MSAFRPASKADEFGQPGTPREPAPTVPPPRQQSHLTSITVADTIPLPAQHNGSFRAKPIKLSVLMAAYNEEHTIAQAIDEILRIDFPCETELIVVDDGSTDATSTLLSRVNDPRVVVHRHPANQGKGAALLAGARLATGTHFLPFDADLEYEPEDISRMLKPLLKGRSDVIYGVRVFGCNTVYQTWLYAVGNRLLTHMANMLFNAHLTDLHTCLKLVPLATLRSLDLSEKGFGLDSELTAQLLLRGIRPFEVPVSYYSRSHADGKKITWRDAVTCARILVRVRLLGGRSCYKPSKDLPGEGEGSYVVTSESSPQRDHIPTTTVHSDGDEFIAATGS